MYRNDASKYFGPYYSSERPLSSAFPYPPNPYALNATATVKELLGRGRKPSDDGKDTGPWVYFSGELDRFGAWAYEDIEPYGELLTPMPSRSSVNLWMGSRGVTAHCHCEIC